ncbi:MAG: F0F1 ATP synthase subunit B [Clostridiales bacterium]|nr:F0F1 ATP synthase subunit B [Clostridiales bacterium]
MLNMYQLTAFAREAAESAEQTSLFSADQMGGYAATILVTIINVAVAFIVIKLFVFKPILKAIKNREELIAGELKDAEEAKKEAELNAETSKQIIDDARAEASRILDEAHEDAGKQAQIIKGKASEEAAEMIERAENEVLRLKKVTIEQMKDEISDLAVEVAGRVIGDVVEHDKLTLLARKHTDELAGEEVD